MQLKTLQIVWHGKEPVLSVDFQPNSHTLVSGGQDGEVKHWEVVSEDDGSPGVRFLSSYPVNSKSVNCVRFSPSGDMLASAGDKGEVLLWRFSAFTAGAPQPQQQSLQQQQRGHPDGEGSDAAAAAASASGIWRQVGLLRGHCDDVLDLAWAPDGSALLSGGIENNCILWDVGGRKSLKWLQDHGHYVQGVAWDPLGRYIASQSADRTARVYAVKPPHGALDGGAKRTAAAAAAAAAGVTSASLAKDGLYVAATLAKCPLQQQPAGQVQQQPAQPAAGGEAPAAPHAGGGGPTKQPLFCDDSLPTFFRRLAWSPDGSFLAAPAGTFRSTPTAPVASTTHIFSRGDWSGPALSLPCLSKGALVVRFCPRLFRAPPAPVLQSGPLANAAGVVPSRLPYRIIMAVASVDSVILYDMQALEPLAVMGGIHFAAVTDLAWSDDGRYLVVASRDGYCTVCSFAEGELGEPVPLEDLPPGVAAAISRAAARRHQERTAAAAAAAAASKSAAAAAAATTTVATTANPTPDPGEGLEEQLSVAVPAAGTAASGAATGPLPPVRRIQPVPVQPGDAQTRAEAGVSGAKRPAEAEPSAVGGGATERPKPKRIQPIPLSATALSAADPAAVGGGGGGGAGPGPGRMSGGGAAAEAPAVAAVPTRTAPAVAAAAAAPQSSPGRRRIVPTRVDGPATGLAAAGAAAAKSLPPQTAAGGLSPLQSAASRGVGAVVAAAAAAGAPSRTPLSGAGMGGDLVPGMAAPGSGVKMPTPQVLVFGTPPGSALQRDDPGLTSERQNGGGAGAAAAAAGVPKAAGQQPAAQLAKPKRVTPVPVDRSSCQDPRATTPAQQPPTGNQNTRQGQHHELKEASAVQPLNAAGGAAVRAGAADGGSVPPAAGAAAAGAAQQGVIGSGGGAAASGGTVSGAGGGGGVKMSLAQLAAMRGAAAARKAAEGAN